MGGVSGAPSRLALGLHGVRMPANTGTAASGPRPDISRAAPKDRVGADFSGFRPSVNALTTFLGLPQVGAGEFGPSKRMQRGALLTQALQASKRFHRCWNSSSRLPPER